MSENIQNNQKLKMANKWKECSNIELSFKTVNSKNQHKIKIQILESLIYNVMGALKAHKLI